MIIWVCGGILVFAPLAFGAVHPWAYFTVGLVVAALSLVLLGRGLWDLWGRPGGVPRPWPAPPLGWVFALLGLLLLCQTLPWPQGLVGRLSPMALELRSWGSGAALAEYLPLSLNPYATILETLKLGPAVGLFFVLLYATVSRRQIRGLVRLILGVALFEVIYGFWHFQSRLIWGWPNPYAGYRLCGTFINSNHLGTYLAMAILLGLGLLLAQAPAPPLPVEVSGRGRFRRWSRREHLEPHFRRFILIFLLLILTVGLIFTGSRGALLSLLGGIGLMGLLLWGPRHPKGYLWALALFLAVALIYSLWLGSSPMLARFGDKEDLGRYYCFHGALALFREFPWVGGGLGAFGDLFFRYEPARLQGINFHYAHSDWLQLAAETGLSGLILLGLGWWVLFSRLLRQWRRRQERFAWGLGLGGLAALGAGALHALGEFSFHIPAVALLYAAVAALTYLTLYQHRQQGREYFSYPPVTWPKTHPWAAGLVLSGLAALLLVLMAMICRFWWAERYAPTEIDSTRPAPRLTAADYRGALSYNGLNSRYYLGLAETLEQQAKAGPEVPSEVEGALKAAIFYAPAHWAYRQRLGEFYLRHYRRAPPRYLPQGLQELAAAVKLFPESGVLPGRLAASLAWVEDYDPDLVPPELKMPHQ